MPSTFDCQRSLSYTYSIAIKKFLERLYETI